MIRQGTQHASCGPDEEMWFHRSQTSRTDQQPSRRKSTGRRRWYQYRLATLLCAVTIVCVALGYYRIPKRHLVLDGYCPVALIEKQAWVPGDGQYVVAYRGGKYWCAGASEMRLFRANPERYAVVFDGFDAVAESRDRKRVLGKREHGLYFEGRIYLFCGEENLQVFFRSPRKYAKINEPSRRTR